MLSSRGHGRGRGGGGGGGSNDGLSAPIAGERFKRPGLAKAIRLLGQKGRAGFYEGDVALAIVEEVQQHGGFLSLEDLAMHTSSFVTPISATYRGHTLWEVNVHIFVKFLQFLKL